MRAYVLIHAHTGEELSVVRQLRGTSGVVRADFTFGPYDLIAEVEAKDLGELGHLVSQTIRCAPGVKDTLTCLAVE